MTEKDLMIQDLREENRKLKEKIAELEKDRWIPADKRLPDTDDYILVSFENYGIPDIARYEANESGGAFYPGDEEESYVSFGLFVNAWQPLPEAYKEIENE